MADPTSLPESVWHWIGALIGGILTVLVGVIGWNFADVKKKGEDNSKAITALELDATKFACSADVSRDYARRDDLAAVWVKMATFASRRELMTYMRLQREQNATWEREQQRQHDENKESMQEIKKASLLRDEHAQAFREEMRKALGDLALKVENVSTIQQVQGAPGGS